MKLNTFTLALAMTFASLSAANACETVMGGCSKVETHDTSSHMKSQIVNQVTHPVAAPAQASNASKVKSNSKQAKGSGNLIQAINKTVLK
ncbi:MAG: hypothetical protein V4575_02580 [Pseudomonadota bacterium]